MDALLARLRRGTRARRQRLVAAAVGALLLLSTGSFFHLERARRLRCGGSEELFTRVWNADARDRVRSAFLATGLPFAESAWTSVSGRLDLWGGGWTGARRAACEATHLRGAQSERLLDLRMACYDRHLREVEALVGVLAGADAEAVELAPEAASRLPALGLCADTERLLARVPPPEDPEVRARLDAEEREVAEVKALRDLGRYDEAAERGRRALASARELGYPPAVAEAAYTLAEVESERGEARSAEALLHEALVSAEAGGDDPLFGRAAAELVWVLAGNNARLEEADRWSRLAEAVVARVGDDPELESMIRAYKGAALRTAGRYPEAAEEMRRALELDERVSGPDSLDVASSLNNLATVLAELGRYDEAVAALDRSLGIKEASFGREHPEVATSLGNVGVTLVMAGRSEEALPYQEEALALRLRTLPPDHPFLGKSHANLASTLYDLGRLEEGIEHDLIGLELRRAALGERHYEVAFSWTSLGEGYRRLGRYDEATKALEEAVSIFEAALGEHLLVAFPLHGLGRTLVEMGEPERATPYFERALALRRSGTAAEKDLAATAFALARALDASGGDRERVRRLAEEALERFGRAGVGYADEAAEVEAWLEAGEVGVEVREVAS